MLLQSVGVEVPLYASLLLYGEMTLVSVPKRIYQPRPRREKTDWTVIPLRTLPLAQWVWFASLRWLGIRVRIFLALNRFAIRGGSSYGIRLSGSSRLRMPT
jgi:hypothetical protein